MRVAQRIIRPLYRHEVAYIIVRNVEDRDALDSKDREKDDMGAECAECIVCETLESLRDVENEIPSVWIDEIKSHLACGRERIVVLARRPIATGSGKTGKTVVGYRTCERGVFFALGLGGRVSSDILFVHHTEVLSEYRGQRVQQAIRAATHDYCQGNGSKKICGALLAHNKPSKLAHTRNRQDTIVGTVELVSVLGGLVRRITPWEKIKDVIQ